MDSRVDSTGHDLVHPWQRLTVGSGLTLHAAANLRLDPAALQEEYATLDATLPQEARGFYRNGANDGWTAITLWQQAFQNEPAGAPAATAGAMPSLHALFAREGWRLRSCYVLRQSGHGTLDWHHDNQALHREEMRLLIPIHAPDGARTLIGHESVAYPEGQAWTGDFCFPHRVENPTERDRIVIAVDLQTTPEIRALFPDALAADGPLRSQLANEAVNAVLASRHARVA